MKGSDFCAAIRHLSIQEREQAVFEAVARGDIYLGGGYTNVDGLMVANDYLAIGERDDFVRMPMGGPNALRVCDLLGCRLPTQAEVDAIYHAADVKLVGNGMGPPWDASMFSVDRIQAHDAETEKDRAGRTGLIAGHRKDVLGVRPWRSGDRPSGISPVLAFYGLFDAHGHAIQHDDGAHEPTYFDGTHGIRLVF